MQLIKGAKLEYFQDHELQHLANAMGKGGATWSCLSNRNQQKSEAKCIEAEQLL